MKQNTKRKLKHGTQNDILHKHKEKLHNMIFNTSSDPLNDCYLKKNP